MGKFSLIPRKEVGFSLGIAHRTLSVQIGWERTSSEPIQVEEQLEEVGVDPESGPGQEDPVTSFPVGAKTRPQIRFASK